VRFENSEVVKFGKGGKIPTLLPFQKIGFYNWERSLIGIP